MCPRRPSAVVPRCPTGWLAQLHPLATRGASGASPCPPVYCVHRHEATDAGRARLQAFAGTTDGFELAEADLRLHKQRKAMYSGPGKWDCDTFDSCRCAATRPSSEPRSDEA